MDISGTQCGSSDLLKRTCQAGPGLLPRLLTQCTACMTAPAIQCHARKRAPQHWRPHSATASQACSSHSHTVVSQPNSAWPALSAPYLAEYQAERALLCPLRTTPCTPWLAGASISAACDNSSPCLMESTASYKRSLQHDTIRKK